MAEWVYRNFISRIKIIHEDNQLLRIVYARVETRTTNQQQCNHGQWLLLSVLLTSGALSDPVLIGTVTHEEED